MRPHIWLSPIAVNGSLRYEVGMLLAYATAWRFENQAKIGELSIYPVQGVVPAPCARNQAVKLARNAKADILVMVDDDMSPSCPFLGTAIEFLIKHHMDGKGPAAIGSPYCCSPPSEDVLAFEHGSLESGCGTIPWKVHRIPREDAARRSGIQEVCNIGTGFIAYTMDCFDKITPPYFAYQYTDEFYTNIVETEDCWAHRRLQTAGVPLFVDWDHWSGHWKTKRVDKPVIVKRQDIDDFYMKQALGILSAEKAQNGTVKEMQVVPNATPTANGQQASPATNAGGPTHADVPSQDRSIIAVNGESADRLAKV